MVVTPPTVDKPSFESCIPEVKRIVWSRKGGWTHVSLMEWKDVASECVIRIMKQWHLYDPKRPLENWCNTLISNVVKNLKRDLGGRYSRPCIGGGKANGASCAYNHGGDSCTLTKSGTQCAECPLYAEWEKTRRHQFNIKSTVALEFHSQEVSTMPQEVFDADVVKSLVDAQMKTNLTQWEWRVYDALYIQHLKPAEASHHLQSLIQGWKRAPREGELTTYQFVLEKQRWFRELMMEILRREGYDLQAFIDYAR